MPELVNKLSRLRWFLIALLSWTVLAAIPTSSAYIADGAQGLHRWFWAFGKIAPYYYLWALATPGIYRLSVGYLSPARGWLQAIAGHLAICAVLTLAFGAVLHWGKWDLWLYGQIAPGYYAMSLFSYVFILLGIYFFILHQTVRQQDALIAEQQKHALELEAGLASSQIEVLRGQMNPHFLFNALNCIGALIETRQNDRAYEALEDLGSLLRTSLEHRNQELVPLSEELDFVKRYVAMERVRFGDRLHIDIDVDSAAAQWMVPPFMLQPLIENTVKHAVAPSRKDVHVTVSARRSAAGIELQVSDDGGGKSRKQDSGGTGVGLENLRKRLELIYGEPAELKFEQDAQGTCVTLHIPERIQSPERKKARTATYARRGVQSEIVL